MKACDDFRDDLDAYRDEALEQCRIHEIEAHLSHCTCCRDEVNRGAAVEAEIRALASTWEIPEHLWARIKSSLDNEAATANTTFVHRRWMAAALLLFTIGFVVYLLPGDHRELQSNTVAQALVNEFHTFVISRRALDYTHSQPAEIRQWFGDKVDFRVPLPVKPPTLILSGGRLCNMLDQRLVSFMYRYDDVWVSLYIWKITSEDSQRKTGSELVLRGYGFIDWQNNGLHYSLVGDIPIERLRELVKDLKSTSQIQA